MVGSKVEGGQKRKGDADMRAEKAFSMNARDLVGKSYEERVCGVKKRT